MTDENLELIIFFGCFVVAFVAAILFHYWRNKRAEKQFAREPPKPPQVHLPVMPPQLPILISPSQIRFLKANCHITNLDAAKPMAHLYEGSWMLLPFIQVVEELADGSAAIRYFQSHQIPLHVFHALMPGVYSKRELAQAVFDAHVDAGENITRAMLYVQEKYHYYDPSFSKNKQTSHGHTGGDKKAGE